MPILHGFLMQRRDGRCEFKARCTLQVFFVCFLLFGFFCFLFFPHSCYGFRTWGYVSAGWIILAAILDHSPSTSPVTCCSKAEYGARGESRSAAVLGACSGGSKPHGHNCESWSLRRLQESMTDDAARTLGRGESSWQLSAGWGRPVAGCWLWWGGCRPWPPDQRGEEGQGSSAQKARAKKRCLLWDMGDGAPVALLGSWGGEWAPFPSGLIRLPVSPSARRERPPRACPRGPDPPLQHEVLPLRAQDAPGPPGQRHQVRSRGAPVGAWERLISGEPWSDFRGSLCLSSEAKSISG